MVDIDWNLLFEFLFYQMSFCSFLNVLAQTYSLPGRKQLHGVQHRMISVDNFFVFLRLLFFALLLLYVT